MSRRRSAHRSKQSQSLQSEQSAEPQRSDGIVVQPAVYDRRKRSKPPVPGQSSLVGSS